MALVVRVVRVRGYVSGSDSTMILVMMTDGYKRHGIMNDGV